MKIFKSDDWYCVSIAEYKDKINEFDYDEVQIHMEDDLITFWIETLRGKKYMIKEWSRINKYATRGFEHELDNMKSKNKEILHLKNSIEKMYVYLKVEDFKFETIDLSDHEKVLRKLKDFESGKDKYEDHVEKWNMKNDIQKRLKLRNSDLRNQKINSKFL